MIVIGVDVHKHSLTVQALRGTVRLVALLLSEAVASLVVAVPRVTRRVTGRRVRALGLNCPRVCGGAGLAPAAGLIRSSSAVSA
jgi:hypothetical protein